MNRRGWIVHATIGCVSLFLLVAPTWGAVDPRAIMEGVYQQDTSHDTTMKAVFDIYDKDGHKTTKKFVVYRLGSPGDSKTRVVFTDPAEIRGVTLLSYNHKGDIDRQWLYIPATQRTRSITPPRAFRKVCRHRFYL
jgi:hypothetical protein